MDKDFSPDDHFGRFELEHAGYGACGISDGDTIVMTGGFGHNYVTRWIHEFSKAVFVSNIEENDLVVPSEYLQVPGA